MLFTLIIHLSFFFPLPAYYIDKVKIRGYYAFKLTEEKSKPRFGFFTSDSKGKPSIKFYNKLISNNGFPADYSVCDPSNKEKECSFCLFISQKKPLIFFACCLFSTLILLLTIIVFHKRKRRKRFKVKNIQRICVSL